jgi:hypothetical protein
MAVVIAIIKFIKYDYFALCFITILNIKITDPPVGYNY